jgi:hypothetical protein
MMDFWVWCEIVCTSCASTIAGRSTINDIDRKMMSFEARQSGWVQTGRDWYCQRCTRTDRVNT